MGMSQHLIDINVPAFYLFRDDLKRSGTSTADGMHTCPKAMFECLTTIARVIDQSSYDPILKGNPGSYHTLNLIFPNAHKSVREMIDTYIPVSDLDPSYVHLRVPPQPVPESLIKWTTDFLKQNGL